jgi:predicted enzyme related to lactoylglutathione lyase
MPEFKTPETGRFCWVELQARDLAAAQAFYGPLLGWTFEEMPMPSGKYVIAKVRGTQVAGLTVRGWRRRRRGRRRT